MERGSEGKGDGRAEMAQALPCPRPSTRWRELERDTRNNGFAAYNLARSMQHTFKGSQSRKSRLPCCAFIRRGRFSGPKI